MRAHTHVCMHARMHARMCTRTYACIAWSSTPRAVAGPDSDQSHQPWALMRPSCSPALGPMGLLSGRHGQRERAFDCGDAGAWAGLDWTGLDWTGLDWTGLDWAGFDWTGLDWTGFDAHSMVAVQVHCDERKVGLDPFGEPLRLLTDRQVLSFAPTSHADGTTGLYCVGATTVQRVNARLASSTAPTTAEDGSMDSGGGMSASLPSSEVDAGGAARLTQQLGAWHTCTHVCTHVGTYVCMQCVHACVHARGGAAGLTQPLGPPSRAPLELRAWISLDPHS